MKKLLLYIFLLGLPASLMAQKSSKTSRYFFIRHAEKVLNVKNPDLTPKGKERAQEWAAMFQHYKIDKVLSTDYKRTIQTAQPIATKNRVRVEKYNPRKFDVAKFLQSTKGKNVVIVGHSNSTPTLVNSFLKKNKYQQIDEKIYGNLYILTIKDGDINDLVLTVK